MDKRRIAMAAGGGALAAIAAAGALWAMPSLFWSNDAWYMAAVGKQIAETGAVPLSDPLTMHEGLPYACQQWSFCLLLWGALSRFGEAGCGALFAGCSVLAACAVAWAGSGGSRTVRPAAWCVPALFLALAEWYMRGTPRGLDVVAMAFGLIWAERVALRGDASHGPRSGLRDALGWAALPAFCAAFANVHGALWPMPLFAPCCAMLDSRSRGRRCPLAAAIAAGTAASALNPSGVATLALPFASLLSPSFSAALPEVRPPGFLSPTGLLCAAFLTIWIVWRVRSRTTGFKLGAVDWMLLASIASAFLSERNFLFAAAAFAIACMRRMQADDVGTEPGMRKPSCPAAFAGAALACGLLLLPAAGTMAFSEGVGHEAEVMEAASLLEDELGGPGTPARVYCSSDIGSMLEYRNAVSGSALLPYMDTRAELFCSAVNGGAPIKEDLLSFLSGDTTFDQLDETYRFDCCLLLADEAQAYGELVEAAGFDKAFENGVCAAYVKR